VKIMSVGVDWLVICCQESRCVTKTTCSNYMGILEESNQVVASLWTIPYCQITIRGPYDLRQPFLYIAPVVCKLVPPYFFFYFLIFRTIVHWSRVGIRLEKEKSRVRIKWKEATIIHFSNSVEMDAQSFIFREFVLKRATEL
jgi:hypothetical protein